MVVALCGTARAGKNTKNSGAAAAALLALLKNGQAYEIAVTRAINPVATFVSVEPVGTGVAEGKFDVSDCMASDKGKIEMLSQD